MMNILKICMLTVFTVTLSSCDCLQHVQGRVVDSETQQPLRGVRVKRDVNVVVLTDSVGNFEFTTMTGGLFGCPKISLSFEKEGYNNVVRKYKSCCTESNIVELKKQVK